MASYITNINLNVDKHGTAASGFTTTNYTVTVQNVYGQNKYFINGAEAYTLNLMEGNTYVFDWSAAISHPFKFSTTEDGTHGGGTEYTTGVTIDTAAYTTTIVVATSAPDLYYYCPNHSGMGGAANTPNGGTSLDSSGNGTLGLNTVPALNPTKGGSYAFLASGTFSSATLKLQHKVGGAFADIGPDASLTAPGGCVIKSPLTEFQLVITNRTTGQEDLFVVLQPVD